MVVRVTKRATVEKQPQGRANGSANGAAGRPLADRQDTVVVARRRRFPWWWAVLLPLLGAALLVGAVLGYDRVRPAEYSSEALVAVLPDDSEAEVSGAMTSIWVEIGNSDAVLDRVADELGTGRETLDAALTVEESANAPLVSIRARTGESARSAAWANVAAEELVAEAEAERVPGWSLEQVTAAQPASRTEPFATVLLIASAAGLGLLAGAAAAQLLLRRHRRRTPVA
jgi:capsular polysaccharide biosynthesis protein